MNPEAKQIPTWAEQERETDLAWIQKNLDRFWETASGLAQSWGRGAIVVDAAVKPLGKGNLYTYFAQEDINRYEDEEIERLVAQYEPAEEVVVVLLKPDERYSSYQLRPQPPLD